MAAALAAGALLFAGCAAVRREPGGNTPANLPDAAALTSILQARHDALQGLRSMAHIRYSSPEESANSRDAVVVQRPDRLRVDVLSMFGPVFVLTAAGGALTAYDRQENTVYRGRASADTLWRYVRLALPVGDVVDLVLGTPPQRAARTRNVSFDGPADAYRLWQGLDDGAQVVWFSRELLPIAAEERNGRGEAQWRAGFGEYRSTADYAFATHVSIELPRVHRSMDITLNDPQLNPPIEGSVFALQTPPGSRVIELDSRLD